MTLSFFFFNDPATTALYTLSLHDALPIFAPCEVRRHRFAGVRDGTTRSRQLLVPRFPWERHERQTERDRKSTRLNSSHVEISYAVFCLKKKKKGGLRRRENQRSLPDHRVD